MGGGGWYYVPKVWTPSGGWWNSPKAWKTNTGIAGIIIFGLAATVFNISAQKERRPVKSRFEVPSQKWIKYQPGEGV